MSDRIAVMREGQIVQIGRSAEIYHSPANRFVANFVGPANEFQLTSIEQVSDRMRGLAGGELQVWLPSRIDRHVLEAGPSLILRPENLRVAVADGVTDNKITAEIEDLVFRGSTTECRLRIGTLKLLAILPSADAALLNAGHCVTVGWNAADGVVTGAQ